MLSAAGATDDNTVAVGHNSLLLMNGTGGGQNTAVGAISLKDITTGINNCAFGYNTGITVQTGVDNVFIGNNIAAAATNTNASYCIGHDLSAGIAGTMVIGDGSFDIEVNWDTDATWAFSSDERMKNVDGPSPLGLEFINDLDPVQFSRKPTSEWPEEWGADPETEVDTELKIQGLIAQNVRAALDKAKVKDFAGWKVTPKGRQKIGSAAFVFPLINAVNELTDRLAALELKLGAAT
jgi:hypothetical protein